jgi:hypothetical protein
MRVPTSPLGRRCGNRPQLIEWRLEGVAASIVSAWTPPSSPGSQVPSVDIRSSLGAASIGVERAFGGDERPVSLIPLRRAGKVRVGKRKTTSSSSNSRTQADRRETSACHSRRQYGRRRQTRLRCLALRARGRSCRPPAVRRAPGWGRTSHGEAGYDSRTGRRRAVRLRILARQDDGRSRNRNGNLPCQRTGAASRGPASQ